jgi:1,2-diacylglycerol 3-alpha-glucosyltransferase
MINKKVLIIPHSPTFDSRGFFLAKHLAELGDEVHFFIWDQYPRDIKSIWQNIKSSFNYETYNKDHIIIHKIRRLPFFFPPINSHIFKNVISRIIKQQGLDIIISESFFNEVEPSYNIPIIYDFVDNHEAYLNIYAKGLEKFGLNHVLNLKKTVKNQINHAKAVIVVSDILVKYTKHINPKVDVYKIPNGVDSLFINSQLKTDLSFGDYSIVYLSTFTRWSNFPKVIRVINILKNKYPNIKLVVVGDGPSIPEAKTLVKQLKLSENVMFLGHINRNNVPEIVINCKISLSPLMKDLRSDSSFPITIMECTALGKVIVSSNLDEVVSLNFPNIVIYDESKGIEELVSKITEAFNMKINPLNIRSLTYKYSWESIAGEIHDLIEKIAI